MPMHSLDLGSPNNPGRYEEIARLHTNAFGWQPQCRIPLGIHVVNPEHAAGLDYGQWLDPEPFFAFQINVLRDTLTVGSDLLPAVAINHLGDAVLTSMFGAELVTPEQGGATLQDVGPTPLPVLSDIEEVTSLEMPGLGAGLMPDVRSMVRYYRERLPEWATEVSHTWVTVPHCHSVSGTQPVGVLSPCSKEGFGARFTAWASSTR